MAGPVPESKPSSGLVSPTPGSGISSTHWVDLGGGVRVERGVRLTLPDGTVLVSDHYYPPGWPEQGPAPTLLVRQPYGRLIATSVVYAQPVWFARHGYNVVIQDVRGRGDSTGEFYPFRTEGRDGAHTIDWLASRPECNGRIGMYGFSYQGLTQLLAAAEKPKALRCISPAQTCGDLYEGWFYHHGALRLASTIGWAAQMLKADAARLRLPEASRALDELYPRVPTLFSRAPYADIPPLNAPGLPSYYSDWISERAPGPYWTRHDISSRYNDMEIPALHVWGWFDTYLHGSSLLYEALTHPDRPTTVAENQYLIAGPWQHIPWGRFAGDGDFGPEAELDTDAILLRWFNHWLKDTGEFSDEPRVRYFMLGENRWSSSTHWPPATGSETRQTSLYLRSDGRANSSKGDGSLSLLPPTGEDPRDTWVDEPEVPVSAPGPNAAPGQFNQARGAQLNNVLVYTSEPLVHPQRVVGAPKVRIFSTSSSPSADLAVKLVRMGADGRTTNICHGIARSSWLFRDSGFKADEVYEWDFPLEVTACAFAAGDRIRLEVSGTLFPLYDRNPGTNCPPHLASSWDWRQSQRQVLHSPSHPSRIELPVIP